MIKKIMQKMIGYYRGDPKRIQHFMKVHSFAKLIGEMENITEDEMRTLEIAALVHDIGIKVCEQKYGDCNGKNQEKEGPAIAKELLRGLGLDLVTVEKVCFLVGNHHTYKNINTVVHQILVEADFIVNCYEDNMAKANIKSVREKIFKTKAGINLFEKMFDL